MRVQREFSMNDVRNYLKNGPGPVRDGVWNPGHRFTIISQQSVSEFSGFKIKINCRLVYTKATGYETVRKIRYVDTWCDYRSAGPH